MYLLVWALADKTRLRQIESEFKDSDCDPGWLTAVAAWVGYYWNAKPPQYLAPDADTGTFDECQANFLEPIERARQQHNWPVPVYTIPGNHDYYSGGQAIFAMLPALNQGIPHASIQTHSFVCLRNDSWQLECMDTGYYDHDLAASLCPARAEWLKPAGRGTMCRQWGFSRFQERGRLHAAGEFTDPARAGAGVCEQVRANDRRRPGYANGYVVLSLEPAAGTAAYYEVMYDGNLSGAASRLVWSERMPATAAAT